MTNWNKIVNKYGKTRMLCATINDMCFGNCKKCDAYDVCNSCNAHEAEDTIDSWLNEEVISNDNS